MTQSIVKDFAIDRVMNAVAAGTSDQDSTVVDMSGWDGVVFVATFGALTATQVTSVVAQGGAAADGSDAASLAGATAGPLADADSNKALVVEVIRPRQRYVRLRVDRGTANAVIDGVIAIRYRGSRAPVTQGTTVKAATSVVSPGLA